MRNKWPFLLLGLLALLIVAVVILRPRRIDWTPSYSNSDRGPFGSYVLYEELDSLFPQVSAVHRSVFRQGDEHNVIYDDIESQTEWEEYEEQEYEGYDNFSDEYNNPQNEWEQKTGFEEAPKEEGEQEGFVVIDTAKPDSLPTGQPAWYAQLPKERDYPAGLKVNYVFVTDYAAFSEQDARTLMYLVGQGATVFLAFQNTDAGGLAKALGLRTGTDYYNSPLSLSDWKPKVDTLTLRFIDPRVDTAGRFKLFPGAGAWYFTDFDSARSEVLAVNDSGQAVLIRTRYGRGSFVLCTTPEVFSNYHLLDSTTHRFIEQSFAYLPVQPLWWDQYYKPGKMHFFDKQDGEAQEEDRGITQFINRNPPLAWAYYLLLGVLAIYLLVGSKRRQRIVPPIAPWRNQTLDFVRSIGLIYFQRGDHADLARKKIGWFQEQLRQRYRLDPSRRGTGFYEHLSRLSGQKSEEVVAFFEFLDRVYRTPNLVGQTLLELDRRMKPYLR